MRNQKKDHYRDCLLRSLISLEKAIDEIHLCTLNLAMQGEWEDINRSFEAGDILNVTHDDFRQMEDKNVKFLVDVVDELMQRHASIQNINAVSNRELQTYSGEKNSR